MHKGFIWRNLKESEHFTDLGVEARTILKWMLMKEGERVWTGLIWLRIGKSEAFF